MIRIPSAEASPRIVNGALYWYVSDRFKISFALELTDQDGESITLGADDKVLIEFRELRGRVMHTFEFDGADSEIVGNTVTLDFDSTVTAKFPKGQYTYDVYLELTDDGVTTRTTLANDNKAVVE